MTLFAHGHALLIGVGAYEDTSLDVPVVRNDAEGIAEALRNPAIGGYPSDQVTLLCNAEATIAGVCDALADLAQRVTPTDTVLVFFGGHGALNTDGTYTFATHETRFVNERILAGTGLSAPELLALLRAIGAQKMLVLVNTCFSGHLHPRLGNVSPRG